VTLVAKMRIVQLYDSFCEKGGVERVVALLLNEWAKQGHDVTLMVRYGEIDSIYPLVPEVNLVTLGRRAAKTRVARIVNYGRDVTALRHSPDLTQADVVIANGPWCGLLAVLALKGILRKGEGPKVVVCDHNSPSAFGWGTRFLSRLLYRRTDCIVALTQAQVPYYQDVAREIRVIPNPVELPESHVEERVRNPDFVLAIGRLSRQKGFDLLLPAWAQVSREVPTAKLVIVGEGAEETSLRQQVSELGLGACVELHPFTDDVTAYYRQATIFVMSSRFEGLPLVLLEAQAHGLPIVSFDCEYGPRQVVTHEKNGLLCPPEDPDGLATALIRLLKDQTSRAVYSFAAQEAARTYSLPAVMEYWSRLFEDLQQ